VPAPVRLSIEADWWAPEMEEVMSKQDENKAVVTEWLKGFWGNPWDPSVVDRLASEEVLVHYPMHGPWKGRAMVKQKMTEFRTAFPDLNFWGLGDLIAEGDRVVARWDGGGTHTGPAFADIPVGKLPANTGRKMRFTGITIFTLKDGKITEEIAEEGALTALQGLGLIAA
jgi:predicted ester cyclase